jgi:putative salt-induced outer membrane protein YdiY
VKNTAVVFHLCFLFLTATACFGQISTEIESSEIIIVSDPSPWSGSVAAGLNGQSGNSQSVDMNLEMNWVRETDTRKTIFIAQTNWRQSPIDFSGRPERNVRYAKDG